MPDLEPIQPDLAVRILLEETDPVRRSRAHLLLGRRALADENEALARVHFEEATDLDPTDERPRAVLESMTPPKAKGFGFGSLLGFLGKRG